MSTEVTKTGDRIIQGEGHDGEPIIITPPSPDNPHNFGPASSRDDLVWTSQRPGGDPSGNETSRVVDTQAQVDEWVTFMTTPERNIRHVFILMSDQELQVYDSPGLIQAYQDAGMVVHHTPYAAPKSYRTIMADLDKIKNAAVDATGGSTIERCVAHCTHGMGRSGRVAAGWLVHNYGLTAEEAVQEALETARQFGVERMGSPRELKAWISESD